MDKNYYDEDGKLCEARVRKNLVLAELGKPLDMPLAILNTHCEFKKEWNKIQNKWHGLPPEVKAKKKEYRQKPEVKAKQKEYYQSNREEILNRLHKRRTTHKN